MERATQPRTCGLNDPEHEQARACGVVLSCTSSSFGVSPQNRSHRSHVTEPFHDRLLLDWKRLPCLVQPSKDCEQVQFLTSFFDTVLPRSPSAFHQQGVWVRVYTGLWPCPSLSASIIGGTSSLVPVWSRVFTQSSLGDLVGRHPKCGIVDQSLWEGPLPVLGILNLSW